MAAATVFSAASGYVVTLLAARIFGGARYQVFAVFWAMFFALTGVLGGLIQETTRAIRSRADLPRDSVPRQAAAPMRVAVLLGIVCAVVLLASSPLWFGRVVSEHATLSLWLLVASSLMLAPQAVLSGSLSGAGLWKTYAALLVLDAGARLGAALGAAAVGGGTAAFLLVTVAGAVSWVVVLAVSRAARGTARLRADVPTAAFVQRTMHAMAAAAAAAALIVGFPVLLAATAARGERDLLGPLILAVTLTRAPFLVPLTSFQSAVVVYLVERRANLFRALSRPALFLAGAAVLTTALAAVLGPPLVRIFFGPSFALPGAVLGALTFGAACTAWLMVTGCAALARARHGLYSGGWLLAGCVSLAVLLLPVGLASRTALALIVGPLVGSALHLLALGRSSAMPDAVAPPTAESSSAEPSR